MLLKSLLTKWSILVLVAAFLFSSCVYLLVTNRKRPFEELAEKVGQKVAIHDVQLSRANIKDNSTIIDFGAFSMAIPQQYITSTVIEDDLGLLIQNGDAVTIFVRNISDQSTEFANLLAELHDSGCDLAPHNFAQAQRISLEYTAADFTDRAENTTTDCLEYLIQYKLLMAMTNDKIEVWFFAGEGWDAIMSKFGDSYSFDWQVDGCGKSGSIMVDLSSVGGELAETLEIVRTFQLEEGNSNLIGAQQQLSDY